MTLYVCRLLHPRVQGIGLNERQTIDKDYAVSYKALSVTSSVRKDEVSPVLVPHNENPHSTPWSPTLQLTIPAIFDLLHVTYPF